MNLNKALLATIGLCLLNTMKAGEITPIIPLPSVEQQRTEGPTREAGPGVEIISEEDQLVLVIQHDEKGRRFVRLDHGSDHPYFLQFDQESKRWFVQAEEGEDTARHFILG